MHRAEHQQIQAKTLQSAHCLQHGEVMPMCSMLCALRDGYIEHIEGLDRE